MAWFKVDDNFYDHPKVDELSLEAVGIWLLCGTYSARHLTDGFIPTRRAYRMGADEHVLEELTESGLWHEVEGGYQFHNWAEYQPTRDSVEESRKKERDRKREYRRNKRGKYTGQQPDVPTVSHRDNTGPSQGESHQPDPTRPDPLIQSTANAEDDTESDFNEWYQNYPRKEGKGQARKAFKAALKKTDLETLKAGLAAYNKTVEGKEKKYIAMPATWLNGERWADDTTGLPQGIDPDEILGPDYKMPPDPPEGLTMQEEIEFKQQWREQRKAERLEEARRKVQQ